MLLRVQAQATTRSGSKRFAQPGEARLDTCDERLGFAPVIAEHITHRLALLDCWIPLLAERSALAAISTVDVYVN